MPQSNQVETELSIADLYPELSEDEREEAEYHLTRYLELVRGVFERAQNLTEN